MDEITIWFIGRDISKFYYIDDNQRVYVLDSGTLSSYPPERIVTNLDSAKSFRFYRNGSRLLALLVDDNENDHDFIIYQVNPQTNRFERLTQLLDPRLNRVTGIKSLKIPNYPDMQPFPSTILRTFNINEGPIFVRTREFYDNEFIEEITREWSERQVEENEEDEEEREDRERIERDEENMADMLYEENFGYEDEREEIRRRAERGETGIPSDISDWTHFYLNRISWLVYDDDLDSLTYIGEESEYNEDNVTLQNYYLSQSLNLIHDNGRIILKFPKGNFVTEDVVYNANQFRNGFDLLGGIYTYYSSLFPNSYILRNDIEQLLDGETIFRGIKIIDEQRGYYDVILDQFAQ